MSIYTHCVKNLRIRIAPKKGIKKKKKQVQTSPTKLCLHLNFLKYLIFPRPSLGCTLSGENFCPGKLNPAKRGWKAKPWVLWPAALGPDLYGKQTAICDVEKQGWGHEITPLFYQFRPEFKFPSNVIVLIFSVHGVNGGVWPHRALPPTHPCYCC